MEDCCAFGRISRKKWTRATLLIKRDFRVGSFSDLGLRAVDVSLTPVSGHRRPDRSGLKSAMNRRGGDMPHKRKTARRCLFSTELRI
jgi:hypothetical protein